MLFTAIATAVAGTTMQSFITGTRASITVYSICKTGKNLKSTSAVKL